jgi:GTPase
MAFKAGFVGLIGLPNAGKSSFLNNVLGETLAIVSHKPQATRKRVQGILSSETGQIVFVDAPGFLAKGKNAMLKFIAEEARQVIRDVDAVMLLVPCDDVNADAMIPLIDLIQAEKKPWIACITKRDLKESAAVEKFVEYCKGKGVEVFGYSVRNAAMAEKTQIINAIQGLLPESPGPLFDPELFTTETVRDIAAEMIRERCFELLKQEIPFGLAVVIDKYKEDKKMIRIDATLLVEKESHKGIVIGRGGEMLKKIGTQAREKLEKMTGEKVFIGLHVSHKQNWTRQERKMKELGYESK